MKSKKILFLVLFSFLALNVFAQGDSKQSEEEPAIVYYVKEITPENVLKLYKLLGVDLQGKTGVKIHFGEEGNKNFLNPELTRLLMQETKATWVETNVLYVSKRRFTDKHIALAKQHGFTFAPIDILDKDGEIDISTEGMGLKHYKNVKLGKGFMDYDNYIIYSHFKGHGSAGFGGAIKNIAMGFASPGGKMAQHASDIPQVNKPSECVSCANCVRNCPASAISIENGVEIDTTKCIGCAKCIAECPLKLFSPKKVELTGDIFLERLVEYAKVATSLKPMVFINVLANISSVCDCSSKAPAPFTQDIGILASRDIVAIDQASLDLVAKRHQCDDPFLKESGKSGKAQLEYAEKLKMGKRKYILVEVK